MAAIGISAIYNLPTNSIVETFASSRAAFGRVETFNFAGRKLVLLLIKNPTGFNQIIETFLLSATQQKIIILINDDYADGRDVSWLWDVAIEDLIETKPDIIVGGKRKEDMLLRLKYAGIDARSMDSGYEGIQAQLGNAAPGETVYLLATYTAMLAIRKYLANGRNLERAGEGA